MKQISANPDEAELVACEGDPVDTQQAWTARPSFRTVALGVSQMMHALGIPVYEIDIFNCIWRRP
jgi:hypothetical protein